MKALGDQKEFDRCTFEGRDMAGLEVRHRTFDSCVFSRCRFPGTDFEGTRFLDCVFRKCDLSLIRIRNCGFIRAKFEDSKAVGVNWTEASWPKHSLHSVDFSGCVLSQSAFIGLSLKKMKLAACIAVEADFSEADLAMADCRGTDFSGSRFMRTDLSGADFREARNYVIHPGFNKLSGAKFSLPEAMSLLYCMDIVIS